MCKKRLAELRDDDLFTQPEKSCYGDCPICCLPLLLDASKSNMMTCCSKSICMGCHIANQMREFEAGLEPRCAFCREPMAQSMEENDKRTMKRIKKNCPVAMREEGKMRRDKGDYESAFEYFTKAAALGNAEAHFSLSIMYLKGLGVDRDKKKAIYHWEEAAIAGHPNARHNLGYEEAKNGRFERAKKHWIIAANLGYHDSLDNLQGLYAYGDASKEEYANALRAYQAAVDATKSSDREKAEETIMNGGANLLRYDNGEKVFY